MAKKIEIVANALELGRLLEALDRAGVAGYTVIRNVIGKGSHGSASDDLEMTTLSNVYVMMVCEDEQVEAIATALRPILKKYGGVSFVSEVQWLLVPNES